MVKPGFVLLILFCYVCNGEEVHCSRYHYEEQILAKVLKLEHQLEKLKEEEHEQRANQVCCPNGWIRFKNSCYLFVERTLTYNDARLNCLTLNSQLVHIYTAEENAFIVSILKTFKQEAHWIGLTDTEQEGHFKWENGDGLTFVDWQKDQPDNASDEDCAHYHAPFNYQWNDGKCSTKFGSICKKTD